jgi:hypothetical protein
MLFKYTLPTETPTVKSEVGIANFFLCLLIANLLIFF